MKPYSYHNSNNNTTNSPPQQPTLLTTYSPGMEKLALIQEL